MPFDGKRMIYGGFEVIAHDTDATACVREGSRCGARRSDRARQEKHAPCSSDKEAIATVAVRDLERSGGLVLRGRASGLKVHAREGDPGDRLSRPPGATAFLNVYVSAVQPAT